MLLEIKNIYKHFKVKSDFLKVMRGVVKAVDGVSLSVKPGEHLSIVGESGCGKTTLARIITQLISQDSGQIIFNGSSVLNQNIQMVFQDPYSSLDPLYTIYDVLNEAFYGSTRYRSLTTGSECRTTLSKRRAERGARRRVSDVEVNTTGLPVDGKGSFDRKSLKEILRIPWGCPWGSSFSRNVGAAERLKRMQLMLKAVQLPENILTRFPHEFSGGERQRIAIARSLMMQPKLLILDEAVSSLDVIIQGEIIELLQRLCKDYDVTYLLISHNLRVVKKISVKIAVMYQGKIVEWGRADDIFRNAQHPYTQELLRAALEYKSKQVASWTLAENETLVEVGHEHYVLQAE